MSLIAACHPLPRKSRETKPAIGMRFVRTHRAALLKQAKKLQGTGIYTNELSTKKNAHIARQVKIRLNGPPKEAKVFTIRELNHLEKHKFALNRLYPRKML